MWDLTTALDFYNKGEPTVHQAGGPTARELVRLLDHCDLTNSRPATPCISPSPSLYPQVINEIVNWCKGLTLLFS